MHRRARGVTAPDAFGLWLWGSGYSTDVDPLEAQRECFRVARDFRGYRGVRVGAVDVTGPETARVELRARTYGGYVLMGCTYDARTGRAYVP
ncbi:hypothetical protein ACN28S_50695 [Cystobacter fuscus]